MGTELKQALRCIYIATMNQSMISWNDPNFTEILTWYILFVESGLAMLDFNWSSPIDKMINISAKVSFLLDMLASCLTSLDILIDTMIYPCLLDCEKDFNNKNENWGCIKLIPWKASITPCWSVTFRCTLIIYNQLSLSRIYLTREMVTSKIIQSPLE